MGIPLYLHVPVINSGITYKAAHDRGMYQNPMF